MLQRGKKKKKKKRQPILVETQRVVNFFWLPSSCRHISWRVPNLRRQNLDCDIHLPKTFIEFLDSANNVALNKAKVVSILEVFGYIRVR